MRARHLLLIAPLLLLPPVGPPAAASSAAPCTFRLGFRVLHDAIPDIVGDCVTDETHNPANGDALQQTTNGLLVWRQADNWTAFTDGATTWINGPSGIQSRPNDQRFAWEGGQPVGTTPVAVTDASFARQVLQADRPVLVHFWAAWCGPCRREAPVLEQVARERGRQLAVATLDVDSNPLVTGEYDIRQLPTLVLFSGGAEAGRATGYRSEAELLDWLGPSLG